MSKLERPSRLFTEPGEPEHLFDAAELLKHPPGSVYALHGYTRPRSTNEQQFGSGFAIEQIKQGDKAVCYISTNDHVANPISHGLKVKLPDGNEVSGKKVFADHKRDIAIVRVDGVKNADKNCKPWRLAGPDQWAKDASDIVRISKDPSADAAAGQFLNYVTYEHGKFKAYVPKAAGNPDNTMLFTVLKAREGNSGSPLGHGTNLAYGMTTIAGAFTVKEPHHKIRQVPMVLGTPSQFIAEDLQHVHRGLSHPPKNSK